MPSEEFEVANLQKLIENELSDVPANLRAKLLSGADVFDDIGKRPEPQIRPVPETVRGFRLRMDLQDTKPPVWRRLEVPGDVTLSSLHEVLQTTMGWTDSHLHCFRTGTKFNAPVFLTRFDADEGDEGVLEGDVRLDQIVAEIGDRLWYDYDFGDGWEHRLRVEKVLDVPPKMPVCLLGKGACPPEDCGGIWGYHELADWVRSDFSDELRPEIFTDTEDGLSWLPEGWHPDDFDLDETNELLGATASESPPFAEGLASLLELAQERGSKALSNALAHAASRSPIDFSDDEATALTDPYRILLEVIGDGVSLTGAGYLKPAAVEQVAQLSGISDWWIGKANREDLTWPVAELRATARSLGLISVRKGHLAPTRVARRLANSPERLLHHIVDRLPLGKSDADRHAGWVSLVVVGSETPEQLWREHISNLMFDLGWRDGRDGRGAPSANNPTLSVLRLLAGELRTGPRLNGTSAVSAAARAATRA